MSLPKQGGNKHDKRTGTSNLHGTAQKERLHGQRETLYDGTTIYERCWTQGIEIAFCGHSKEHYRIEAWINGYCPMVRVIKNDRVEGNPRDYSSPKRAINAIAEIARCAGYTL